MKHTHQKVGHLDVHSVFTDNYVLELRFREGRFLNHEFLEPVEAETSLTEVPSYVGEVALALQKQMNHFIVKIDELKDRNVKPYPESMVDVTSFNLKEGNEYVPYQSSKDVASFLWALNSHRLRGGRTISVPAWTSELRSVCIDCETYCFKSYRFLVDKYFKEMMKFLVKQ